MNALQTLLEIKLFKQIEEKDDEIAQLKEKNLRKDALINELADALQIVTQLLLVSELPIEIVSNKIRENHMFQQRAREAKS